MLEKNRQWICKFIALFIFISGMCFEDVKADSVFVCTMITNTVSYIQASGEELSDVDACTTEMLGARSASATRQIAHPMTNGRRELKLLMLFLCVATLSQLLINSYAAAYIALVPERACKTVVVNYIHNTDGKKRI